MAEWWKITRNPKRPNGLGYSLFGVIFCHSNVPCFRIWGDFPSFHPSTVPAFRFALMKALSLKFLGRMRHKAVATIPREEGVIPISKLYLT